MSNYYYEDNELIKNILWKRTEKNFESDVLISCGVISKTSYGIKLHRITILDRMTGFGYRDVETGYKSNDNQFWLASGNFDIRYFGNLTINEAIDKIKKNSNNCDGGYFVKCFPIKGVNHEPDTANT